MAAHVRLLPAMMVTAGVVLGLKAVALAATAAEAASSPVSGEAPAAPGAQSPKPAGAAPAACPAPSFAEQAGLSATEVEVLQSLGARRTALDDRETEMSTQAQMLAAAEKRVEERLAELKRVQGEVAGLLGKLDEQQESRVAGMVNVYSKMKAKDAAQIFEGLDPPVLLEVASRMKQANLAEIMGGMSPEAARRLTKALVEKGRIPDDVLQKSEAAAAAPPAKAKPG